MLGHRGAELCAQRALYFHQTQTRVTRHRGSKKPSSRNYKQGTPGFRHNRRLNLFNEMCYERGILHAVRRDYQ